MTDPRAGSVGVYVHWPYCARICPYCDFNVVRDRGRVDEQTALADAIVADLEAQRALTGERRLLSIFFGGGTPSLMDPAQVARVIETAKRLWSPAADLEISLEANPTDAETGRFAALADAGVQRLSLGVQALDDASLKALGRNHDAGSARRAIVAAAKAFPRLSIDLIYARPGQTDAAWRAELAEAIAMGPEHVSPYQLTIEHGTAFDRAVGRGTLVVPDEDLAATLFETTQEVLEALTPTRCRTTPEARPRARGTTSSTGGVWTMSALAPAPTGDWPLPKAAPPPPPIGRSRTMSPPFANTASASSTSS